MKKRTLETEQHEIFNVDYTQASSNIDRQCYKIDTGLIKCLLENGANIHQRDMSGNTVLHHALEILHPKTIEILLDYNAQIDSYKSANRNGITPLKEFSEMYKGHLNLVQGDEFDADGEDYCDVEAKGIMQKLHEPFDNAMLKLIENKEDYKNNLFKFGGNIFPQMLLMYNHLLFMKASDYVKNWSVMDQKELEELINKYFDIESDPLVVSTEIPLIKGIFKDDLEIVFQNSADTKQLLFQKYKLEQTTKSDKQELFELKRKIWTIGDQIKREKEKQTKEKSSNKRRNKFIIQLEDKQIELSKQLKSLDKDADETLKELSYLDEEIDKYGKKGLDNYNKKIKEFSSSPFKHNNPAQLYDAVQKKLFEDNHYGYNKLWKLYINDKDRLVNMTNIHLLLVRIQSELLKKLSINPTPYKDLARDFQVISNFYSKIVKPLINDYDQLPQYVRQEDNPHLTDVSNIIVHIIENVITSNLYNAINKYLGRYVVDKYQRKKGESLEDNVENILEQMDKTLDLKNYMFGTFTMNVVKNVLGRYTGDYDPTRDTKLEDLFEPIITEIKKQGIKEDDDVIKNLRSYVFPYYKDMYTNYITNMDTLINNYNKFLLNEQRYAEVMAMLLGKVGESV
jgi:hypothetical protein